MQRPSWNIYFIKLALLVSSRSHDTQTKHGCVIVNDKYQILGCGYNGFPRGISNSLPNTRPEKYNYIIHAETNAIFNCVINPSLISGIKTAYITGQPCNNCFMYLWHNDIKHFIVLDRQGSKLENSETKLVFDKLYEEYSKDKNFSFKYINENIIN